MIKISVDEGYALDMLAISLVKSRKNSSTLNYQNYFNLANEIKDQITLKKFSSVIDSSEFDELVEINSKVFTAVDKAKTDDILASEVDSLNYKRYLAKKKIQQKFFSGELKEQKLGY